MKRDRSRLNITSNWQQVDIKATTHEIDDMLEWCNHNGSNGLYALLVRSKHQGFQVRLDFENTEDATLFIMRWCK